MEADISSIGFLDIDFSIYHIKIYLFQIIKKNILLY
jgi:hypothetical protein